jgi:hypothetical protein
MKRFLVFVVLAAAGCGKGDPNADLKPIPANAPKPQVLQAPAANGPTQPKK